MNRGLAKDSLAIAAESGTGLRLWVAGAVQLAAGNYPVRVRELRRGVAILEGWARPPVGSMVMLTRGMLAIPAVVLSSGGSTFEVALRRPADEAALLAAAAMATPAQPRMAPPYPFDPRFEDGLARDVEDDFATFRC
jgi:hypothetical protein